MIFFPTNVSYNSTLRVRNLLCHEFDATDQLFRCEEVCESFVKCETFMGGFLTRPQADVPPFLDNGTI